jgi:hypothetical protein
MKRIGDIAVIAITVFGLPGIIQLASKDFYNKNATPIWLISGCLAAIPSFFALNLRITPVWNRTFRTIGYQILKTKVISIFLIAELAIILTLLIVEANSILESKYALLSVVTNLIALNLLILTGKISNTDKKQLVLHNVINGKIFLQLNHRLRYVPDPPTFDLLGLSWSDLIDINDGDLASYILDPPITSVKDMQLISYRGRVYGIVNDKLRHVPNEKTLQFILQFRDNKAIEGRTSIDGYEIDIPFASTC